MKRCMHCEKPLSYARQALHEISHVIFGSDNPDQTARIFRYSPEMYNTLVKAVDPDDFVSTKEIRALLHHIDSKEDD